MPARPSDHPNSIRNEQGDVLVRLGAASVVLLLALGCGSTPKSQRLPSQTMSPTPMAESEPSESVAPVDPDPEDARDPRESAPPTATDGAAGDRGLTVVIEEPSSQETRRRTLVEAAASERERRKTSGAPIAVITNENLKDYAHGQLTEMEPEGTASDRQDPATQPSGEGVTTVASEDPESYWRGRVLQARMNWASAVEEIRHLDETIAELRQRFYAEEDPYYRDSRIKPSWDRALDRLEEARRASEEFRKQVGIILEEGRRAGALPGWLREGSDLEPTIDSERASEGPTPPGEYRPGEPKVAADPDGAR